MPVAPACGAQGNAYSAPVQKKGMSGWLIALIIVVSLPVTLPLAGAAIGLLGAVGAWIFTTTVAVLRRVVGHLPASARYVAGGLLLGETLTPAVFAALFLVGSGIWVANRP